MTFCVTPVKVSSKGGAAYVRSIQNKRIAQSLRPHAAGVRRSAWHHSRAVANWDLDRSDPSDAVISLICRVFNVREAWLRDGTGEMLEQLTEDEDRARFFGGLSKENASPEVLAFIDALRKTPEPAIRSALEFVCNVYESYNALQKEKGSESK